MPERWVSIFSGRYAVSDQGRIMRVDSASGTQSGRILKPIETDQGYLAVHISVDQGDKQDNFRVHRLVADAFLPFDPDRPYINHKNGYKKDNRIVNLERCTNKENALHASDNGWLKHGSDHKLTHLNEIDVFNIRQRFKAGEKFEDLGREFSITIGTISPLVRGKTWKHVPGAVIKTEHSRAKITEEDVVVIRKKYRDGISQAALCREYHLTRGTMSELVNNKTWKHVTLD